MSVFSLQNQILNLSHWESITVSPHWRGRSSGSGGYDIHEGLRYDEEGDRTK